MARAPDHYKRHAQPAVNRHDKNRETINNPKLGRGGVIYCDGHYEYCERWKSFDPYYNDPLYTGPSLNGAY
jgi:hypothetical protein